MPPGAESVRLVFKLAGWSTGPAWSGLSFGVRVWFSCRRVDADEVGASLYFEKRSEWTHTGPTAPVAKEPA